MKLTELLSPQRVAISADVSSKKRTLEVIGALIANADAALAERDIFDSLIGRERLGSTGLGHGVALPHGRMGQAEQAIGAFVRLESGVDFDAPDREPVDLVFGLVVPEHYTDEHLKILAHLAEMFSDRKFCVRLREAADDASVHRLLTEWQPGHA